MNWNRTGRTRDSQWTARVGVSMIALFIEFVQSRAGREILRRTGHWIP